MKQILINLISNSIKFSCQGIISLNITSNEDYMDFEVKDTGLGLNESEIQNIQISNTFMNNKLNH